MTRQQIRLTDEERQRLERVLAEAGFSPEDFIQSGADDFSIFDRKMTDEDVAVLCKLTHLKHLILSRAGITDHEVSCISALKSLEELNLDNNPITDRGLECLKGMTSLKRLSLSGTRVTDAGIITLLPLTGLTELDLYNTSVTEQGLMQLTSLGQLSHVNVEQVKINILEVMRSGGAHLFVRESDITLSRRGVVDGDLTYLTDSEAQIINLEGNQITGTGLQYLAGLKRIKHLHLSSNPLVGETLTYLYGLETLRSLNIKRTNVDPQSILALKMALPGLNIRSDFDESWDVLFQLKMAFWGLLGRFLKHKEIEVPRPHPKSPRETPLGLHGQKLTGNPQAKEAEWSMSDLIDLSTHSPRYQWLVHSDAIDVRTLPVTTTTRGKDDTESIVSFFLSCALCFTIPGYFFIRNSHEAFSNPWFWIPMDLGCVFLFLFLNKLSYTRTITITRTNVSYCSESILRKKHWVEALRNYKGVLLTTWIGKKRKRWHELTLFHEQPDRNVRLLYLKGQELVRRIWKIFAGSLNMPALEETKDGIIRHSD